MKIFLLILAMLLALTGCGAQPTFETLGDNHEQPVVAQAQKIWTQLPEDAQMQTLGSEDSGELYFCGDMTVSMQTLDGGDLDRTLRTATGFGKDQVCMMESYSPYGKCYECVWTAAGEGGMQVGRTRIIDDGNYHYTLSVMVPEESAGELQTDMRLILDSFSLVDSEYSINTGS